MQLKNVLFLTLACLIGGASASLASPRPNIVWIISEDNSIHYLKHFFPDGENAPNIEALAKHGLTFDNAFSNAPVCSVARTTLATCCWAAPTAVRKKSRSVRRWVRRAVACSVNCSPKA